MIKRTHCYVMQPNAYEISGCPNSTPEFEHEVIWSEYEKHLWCFVCEQDFIPEHNGIFDGPIPMGAATLLGISFDRINIKTGEIIKNPYVESTLENNEVNQQERETYNSTWVRG